MLQSYHFFKNNFLTKYQQETIQRSPRRDRRDPRPDPAYNDQHKFDDNFGPIGPNGPIDVNDLSPMSGPMMHPHMQNQQDGNFDIFQENEKLD